MRTAPLSDLALINPRNTMLDPSEAVDFVGMAELDADTAIAHPRATVPFGTVSKGYTVFRDEDILLAKITPCWENGKVGQAHLRQPTGVGSTEFHVVRPMADVDSRYLMHFLRTPNVRATGRLRMTGSGGQRRVPSKYLHDLEVPLPSPQEQRRIAGILDHADALRAKRRQVLAHLDDLTQSIFHDMFGDPATWPGRWDMGVIGDLTESVQYGTSAKAGPTGEWPVLRMGNVTDEGRLDLSDMKFLDLRASDVPKYTVRRGDLLFNRTNSKEKVGKTAVVRSDNPLALAGYLIRVRLRPEHHAEFVSAYMTSAHGLAVRKRMAKAAVNQANINATELRAIRISIPPPELQKSFAHRVEAVENQREMVLRARVADEELFVSLQSRAFRGEL